MTKSHGRSLHISDDGTIFQISNFATTQSHNMSLDVKSWIFLMMGLYVYEKYKQPEMDVEILDTGDKIWYFLFYMYKNSNNQIKIKNN